MLPLHITKDEAFQDHMNLFAKSNMVEYVTRWDELDQKG